MDFETVHSLTSQLVATLNTFECRYTTLYSSPQFQNANVKATFFRKDRKECWKVQSPFEIITSIDAWNQSVYIPRDRTITVSKDGRFTTSFGDALTELELRIQDEQRTWILPDFIDHYKSRTTLSQSVEGGIQLVISTNQNILTYQLSPKWNYFPVEVTHSTLDGNIKSVRTFEDFKDYGKGVYLPARKIYKAYRKGVLDANSGLHSTFESIRVNHTIDNNVFIIKYPPKSKVHDLANNKVDEIGPNGELLSTKITLVSKDAALAELANEQKSIIQVAAVSMQSHWVLYALISIMIIAPVFLMWQRWRRKRMEG